MSRRCHFEPQFRIDLPGPSFRQSGQISLSPQCFSGIAFNRTLVPINNGQCDAATIRARPHPHINQSPLGRRDDRTGHRRTHAMGQASDRGELRHGDRRSKVAASFLLQR